MEKVTQAADALCTEDIAKDISRLKSEIGKMLVQAGDQLEEAIGKYRGLREAIALNEKELQEIYEIQKAASSLKTLLELQQQKRDEFQAEMAQDKEELEKEIETAREEWESVKKAREDELKERQAAEKKQRDREKEEYEYAFKRDQQMARQKLTDELAKLEREIAEKKVNAEKELAEREKAVAQREAEFQELKKRAEAFPRELDAAAAHAVKDLAGRLGSESAAREQLLLKDREGERNVFLSKIESLEKAVKDQAAQILKLTQQQEKAYAQVQDIAIKAIEGSSNSKTLSGLQQIMSEQSRKPMMEK